MHGRLIRVVPEFRMALSAFMWSGSSCRSAPISLKLFRCSSVWLNKATASCTNCKHPSQKLRLKCLSNHFEYRFLLSILSVALSTIWNDDFRLVWLRARFFVDHQLFIRLCSLQIVFLYLLYVVNLYILYFVLLY